MRKLLISLLASAGVLLGFIVLLTLLGFHGDNWSDVVFMGQVVDAETGRPIAGVGYVRRYWVDGNEFSDRYARDPCSVDIQIAGQTDEEGRFEYSRNLHWAIYPMNLFNAPRYQPLEIFFRSEGYRDKFLKVRGIKVKRSEVPGQIVDLGAIGLIRKDSDSE